MKGQAINIDWTVGLAVFLTAIVGGVIILSNNSPASVRAEEASQKAYLTQEALREETFREGRKSPLVVDTPLNVSARIPVDTSYIFPEDAYAGSGAIDIPADINISNKSVITTISLENTSFSDNSHHLSYFFSNTSNLSYDNNIDTGSWINNSMVNVKPGGPGLESLRISGNEVLNSSAELNSNDFSTEEKELHASTLDSELKVYNNSQELILEDASDVTFNLTNMTTLYWYRDNSTQTLAGTGTFKSGDTKGFAVASNHGITFIGDMTATVSKPDRETVKAEIDTSRLRIFLHDTGHGKGRKRIRVYDRGDIFFGTAKKIEGASQDKIDELENLGETGFENRLELEDVGYNITFGSLENGSEIPLQDVSVSDRPSVKLGRNGNYSRIDSEVAIWR